MDSISIVIWFCFAVGCALFAQRKNRSTVGWFLWGIIGGIFTLGILALLPTINANNGYEDSNSTCTKPSYKKCPYCAEQILYEAVICKHCKKNLN